MSLLIAAEPIPLALDGDGVARVSDTRVTLESLVTLYTQGATAEEIAQRYPVLPLSDVYAVIGDSLRHRNDVEEYLALSRLRADEARRDYASQLAPHRLRDRLLAHRPKA